MSSSEHEDARAEAAIMSAADAYRLVDEARQMRAERDAALAEAAGLRAAFIRHRTATHEVAPTFCKTCQASDEALALASAGGGECE